MHLISSNKTFGYFFSAVFLILSLVFYLMSNENFLSIFIFSFILLIITYFIPDILTPLNKLWELFGILLHKIVSNFIIIVIYFSVFSTMGIFLRIFGFDPFNKKEFKKNKTYWKLREDQPNKFRDLF